MTPGSLHIPPHIAQWGSLPPFSAAGASMGLVPGHNTWHYQSSRGLVEAVPGREQAPGRIITGGSIREIEAEE